MISLHTGVVAGQFRPPRQLESFTPWPTRTAVRTNLNVIHPPQRSSLILPMFHGWIWRPRLVDPTPPAGAFVSYHELSSSDSPLPHELLIWNAPWHALLIERFFKSTSFAHYQRFNVFTHWQQRFSPENLSQSLEPEWISFSIKLQRRCTYCHPWSLSIAQYSRWNCRPIKHPGK